MKSCFKASNTLDKLKSDVKKMPYNDGEWSYKYKEFIDLMNDVTSSYLITIFRPNIDNFASTKGSWLPLDL